MLAEATLHRLTATADMPDCPCGQHLGVPTR